MHSIIRTFNIVSICFVPIWYFSQSLSLSALAVEFDMFIGALLFKAFSNALHIDYAQYIDVI
jgi:hypothetical protein